VIVIFTDDHGYEDVGCFGSDIPTPNLDRMAAEGLRLTDFYAAQAVCSASRAALLTGCYPNRVGIHNAYMPNARTGLDTSETTIADMLKTEGYATAIFGKWHLGDHPDFMPLNQGFDTYFGIPYSNDMWPMHPQQGPVFNFGPLPLYEDERIIDTLTDQSFLTKALTERSTDFIRKHSDEPFFLYLAHPQPHVPLFASEDFRGKSGQGLYADVIMEIDWSVGQILETLESEGLSENTLVIFTSDNGPWLNYGTHAGSAYPLREGKGTAWEGGQREPCIVYYPGTLPAGRTLETPMMAIDVLPTIAEATGASLPEKIIDGNSYWSVWTGDTTDPPQDTYFFYYRVNELHGVRYKDWKLYFPHTYRTLNGRPGGEGGLPVPYEQDTLRAIELYDLSTDISETTNVADQYPAVVDTIVNLADAMRVRLGDRLTGVEGKENRPVGRLKE
jgi:arylsulfatase